MKITEDIIKKVADATLLSLDEKDIAYYKEDFQTIIDYFELLKEVDTKNVEPAFHALSCKDHLRDDIIKASLSQDEALKLVIEKQDGFIIGPKTV